MGFIRVRNKTTKQEQRVPEHWLDHPVLGAGFEKIAPARTNSGGKSSTKKKEGSNA